MSDLVGNPEDRLSHNEAHLVMISMLPLIAPTCFYGELSVIIKHSLYLSCLVKIHILFLNLIAYWVIFHAFLSSADFFQINFLKKFFQEYHQNVKQFGPSRFVGPDLGPNCLPRLSADVIGRQRVKLLSQSDLMKQDCSNVG